MTAYVQSLDTARLLILILIVLLGLGGLLLPLLRYLRAGWEAKSKDIMEGLDAAARIAYFRMFNRTAPVPDEKTAVVAFNAFYSR